MQSDWELLAAFRAGSPAAFAELVSRHINWIYSVAQRRVGDAHLAEDITQTVLIALAHECKTNGGGNVAAWLFRVVRFASAKAIRSESRRRRHEAAAARPDVQPANEAWEMIGPALDKAVQRLPRLDRQAILLRFYQQQNFGEIGSALAITEEGARKRVARAVAKLRKHFGVKAGSVAVVTAILEQHATQAAPLTLADSILPDASSAAARRAKELVKRMHLMNQLHRSLVAAVILAAIFIVCTGLWIARKEPTGAHLAAQALAPPAVTAPANVTLAQLIDGVRKSESSIQNLYIKNFQTTLSERARDAAQYAPTPIRYAGSAWYSGDSHGPVRVYFTDQVMPWEQSETGPKHAAYVHSSEDLSWDGKQGRELELGSDDLHGVFHKRHQAWSHPEIPAMLGAFSRYETGAGYTLQFMLRDDGIEYQLAPEYDPLSKQIAGFGKHVLMNRETVNGVDAIRVSFDNFDGMTFWFAPDSGYALVKELSRMDLPNEHRASGWEVQNLKQIAPGVWFPLRASWFHKDTSPFTDERLDYRAEDAVANDPNLSPDIFNAEIPVGWIVYEEGPATRKTFVTGPDGTGAEIHPGDILPRIRPGIAQPPDGSGAHP